VLYALEKLPKPLDPILPDLCASIQAAIVDVLVAKTMSAARQGRERIVAVSGGVSMNSSLRAALGAACLKSGLDLRLAAPELTTDNAAMIAHVAGLRLAAGLASDLTTDVDPNLSVG
jgi:N6-L-threonylcarbamoyladenine synthase